MSADAFRRVGRGGAGNYYSKQDIQDAEKATDLEAQTSPSLLTSSALSRTQTKTTISSTASGSAPNYARTGRGGAGNFTFPTPSPSQSNPNPNADPNQISPDTAATAKQNDEEQQHQAEMEAERKKTAAVVAASIAAKSRAGGLSGRGGAGNWTDGNDKGKEMEEEERQVVEELEMRVLREVEGGLAVPGRVYHGPGLGQTKRG